MTSEQPPASTAAEAAAGATEQSKIAQTVAEETATAGQKAKDEALEKMLKQLGVEEPPKKAGLFESFLEIVQKTFFGSRTRTIATIAGISGVTAV